MKTLLRFTLCMVVAAAALAQAQEPYSGAPVNGEPIPIPATDYPNGFVRFSWYNEGGEGVGFHDSDTTEDGGGFRGDPVDGDETSVGWVNDGEWFEYTVDIAQSGWYNVTVYTATPQDDRDVTFTIDGEEVVVIDCPNTGDWGAFVETTVEEVLVEAAGIHQLRATFDGANNYQWFRFDFVRGRWASNVAPKNDAVDVPIDSDLVWLAPPEDLVANPEYEVVFGPVNPTENPTDPSLRTFTPAEPMVPNAQLGLEYDTTYFWRVDVIEPNELGEGIAHPGDVWRFTTYSEGPYLRSQPQTQVVEEGGAAVFHVEADALIPETYQWYVVPATGGPAQPLSDGGAVSGAATDTLTLSPAGDADMGDYYVRVWNSVRERQSDPVKLIIKHLMGYYPLDGNVNDYSGSGHDGVLLANDPNTLDGVTPPTADYVDGLAGLGQAVLFDGSTQFAYLGVWNPSEFSGQLTVSLWARWNGHVDGMWQGLAAKRNSWTPNETYWQVELDLNAQDGLKGLQRNGDPGWSGSTNPLPVDQWTHVTATYDGRWSRLYVNGLEVLASDGGFTFGPTPGANLGFGASEFLNAAPAGNPNASLPWAGNFFNGALDEVRIYNYALDKYEAAQVYATDSGESVCPEYPPLDYDQSCTVDVGDLLIVLEEWMECNIVPDCYHP